MTDRTERQVRIKLSGAGLTRSVFIGPIDLSEAEYRIRRIRRIPAIKASGTVEIAHPTEDRVLEGEDR
jgi:hypothetical protein